MLFHATQPEQLKINRVQQPPPDCYTIPPLPKRTKPNDIQVLIPGDTMNAARDACVPPIKYFTCISALLKLYTAAAHGSMFKLNIASTRSATYIRTCFTSCTILAVL